MKNLADFRVCREEGGDAGRGRRTLRVPFFRHRKAGADTPSETERSIREVRCGATAGIKKALGLENIRVRKHTFIV